METIAFCEIEPYCQKVLKKHWPDVPIYEDVRHVTAGRLKADGIIPDVITAGFPCQDISLAGKQAGIDGERSGLWSECARILGEFRPRYAIFENVTALLSGSNGKWFERVLWDISQVGYDAEWHCIPASAVGAPHRRDRVWIIAYPGSDGIRQQPGRRSGEGRTSTAQPELNGSKQPMADTDNSKREPRWSLGRMGRCMVAGENEIFSRASRAQWPIEPDVGRVANGIPRRVDRLKGLGNAVVPQIPEIIGRAIMEAQ